MRIGERIREQRKHYELTLAYVSAECGISLSHLSDIEHGRCMPSLLTTEKIAEFFGMNLSAFLQFVTIGPACDEPANNPLHLTSGDCAPEINLNNNPACR